MFLELVGILDIEFMDIFLTCSDNVWPCHCEGESCS